MSVFFSLHPIWIVIQYLLDFYLSGWWLLVVSCIVCMLWFVYKTWNILFRIDQYRNWLHWVGFFACLSHAIAYFPSSNCKQFECCMACYFWGVNKRFMHCRNIPTFSVFSCTKAFPSDWNVSENFYIHIHTDQPNIVDLGFIFEITSNRWASFGSMSNLIELLTLKLMQVSITLCNYLFVIWYADSKDNCTK